MQLSSKVRVVTTDGYGATWEVYVTSISHYQNKILKIGKQKSSDIAMV